MVLGSQFSVLSSQFLALIQEATMNLLNVLSLILEAATMLTGLWIGLAGKKLYGYLIALTFLIYVVYDLSRVLNATLPAHDLIFLVANGSIFVAVWMIRKN